MWLINDDKLQTSYFHLNYVNASQIKTFLVCPDTTPFWSLDDISMTLYYNP
jgi:hypothetical protein